MRDDGGPAFPSNGAMPLDDGMSLRDYFAAASLQGMRARHGGAATPADLAAFHAYADADAMLAERKK